MKILDFFGYLALLIILAIAGSFAFHKLSVFSWDNKISELCRNEGGVTVFEQIVMTRDELESYGLTQGDIRIPRESASKSSELPYFRRTNTIVINDIKPQVIKMESSVIRKHDNFEMAKTSSYSRVMEWSWMGVPYDSGFGCGDVPQVDFEVNKKLFKITGD